jgi:hypothetical protein
MIGGKERPMRSRSWTTWAVGAVLAAGLATAGCAEMTAGQQRALSGGAMGAAGGAIIGAIAGDAALGAAIGGGVGILGGAAVNQYEKAKQRSYEEGYRAGQSQ